MLFLMSHYVIETNMERCIYCTELANKDPHLLRLFFLERKKFART